MRENCSRGIDRLDLELMLCEVLGGVDRSYLVAHGDEELSAEQLARLNEMLRRRESGEPLAYILGRKEFWGRDFMVNPDVLIPRPESEAIIRLALELEPVPRRILDVGTGSGCLAITLATEVEAEVSAEDYSEKALAVARRNAEKLGAKVEFFAGNLLEKVENTGGYDLIVANLPYVDEKWGFLDMKALSFEPKMALFAEDEGLFLIKKLIKQVAKRCKTGVRLILEADECQHAKIRTFAESQKFEYVKSDGLAMLFRLVGEGA